MKLMWQALIAALQFLTRVPVPIVVPFTNTVLRRSTLFFPVAGMVVGLAAWGSGWLLLQVLPPQPAAALTLLIMIGMTGGLHLDGLMDTADGVLSGRSRERMLEIMKDSRVGAMGVIACVIVLLVQWSLLATLMDQGQWGPIMVLSFIGSRFAMIWAIAREPHARAGSGLGAMFQGLSVKHIMGAFGIGWLLSGLFVMLEGQITSRDFYPLYAFGIGACILLIALFLAFIIARKLSRKLGGLTGDTYGAICELTLTILLMLHVILLNQGWF